MNDQVVPTRMEQAFQKPGGRVEEVVMEGSIVERLKPNLPSMEHTSQAVFCIMETTIPGYKDTLLKSVHTVNCLCLPMFAPSFGRT